MPQEKVYTEFAYFNLRGDIEMAMRNSSAAIESQRQALLMFPSLEPYAAISRACAAQRDWRGAIQAREQYLKFKGMIICDDFAGAWVLAHLELARTFVRAGDTQQALRYYDEFLRLWAGADKDLPALRQARAERERLVSKGSQQSLPPR